MLLTSNKLCEHSTVVGVLSLKKLKNHKSPKFRFLVFFGEISHRSYLIPLSFLSFVVIYRKRCDRENNVQDVLAGSEFFVQYYLYTKALKTFLKTFKNLKNLKNKDLKT